MENGFVTITLERYNELLNIETRVSVLSEQIIGERHFTEKDCLKILGTKEAIDAVKFLEDKEKQLDTKLQDYRNKYNNTSEES